MAHQRGCVSWVTSDDDSSGLSYLIAMLWQVEKYTVDSVVLFLRSNKLLSASASCIGKLLRSEDVPSGLVDIAEEFWRVTLRQPSIDAPSLQGLAGFEHREIELGPLARSYAANTAHYRRQDRVGSWYSGPCRRRFGIHGCSRHLELSGSRCGGHLGPDERRVSGQSGDGPSRPFFRHT